jgi:hypothetical protein
MRAYVRPSLLALVALAGAAAVAGAQSLGELAAKEKERQEKERQKRGGASKVITENDLGGAGRGTMSNAGSTAAPEPEASASPAAAASPGQPAAAKEKTAEEIRAEQENDWRQRIGKAREEVAQLSAKADRLQLSLNDLSANLYSSSRTNAIQELENTKTQLAAARQKVADLENEGSRNSYR